MNLEIETTLHYSHDDVLDILSDVFETGIIFWGVLDNTTSDWREARNELRIKTGQNPYICEIAEYVLDKGKSIHICDIEDENEVYSFNKDDFENGIRLSVENGHWDGDMDTIDSEVADIIVQYACMGEIVFG